MNKTILIDVDNTLLRSDKVWWYWLCNVTNTHPPFKPWKIPNAYFDFTLYFKEALKREGLTGNEFWGQAKVYDNHMNPVEGSQEAVRELFNMGYTLVPVSKVMGLHGDSKRHCIKKLFPEMEECIFTHYTGDKGRYIRGDYVIEDNPLEINTFPVDTKAILLHTPYQHPKTLTRECYVAGSWGDVINYFRGEEK